MSAVQPEQTINIGRRFAEELKYEAAATRKMLERLPAEQFGWKPHEKSMTLAAVAGHIVDMISWTVPTITQTELDFAKTNGEPKQYADAAELVAEFDRRLAQALDVLDDVPLETMREEWTLRSGDHVIFKLPKSLVMRTFVMSHFIHHRGQLSVYMRLLDIAVPSIYGPSGDEQ